MFCVTIFWSAFLLFVIQPLIAKFILPWFGGTAAVWTTCMLFFQTLLLAGYAYAHLSITRLTTRQQVFLHLGLLATALLFLPIQPSEFWKPADSTLPIWRILVLLGATVGLPYLVLSATGPLMQSWFSKAHPSASPYRLYALSNTGSLLALLSYPLVLERHLTRGTQAIAWSIGLAVFAGLAVLCGVALLKRSDQHRIPSSESSSDNLHPMQEREPRWLWFSLPACATLLLLAITNKICQDVAVIPFLWVAPLTAYLLSFIISFDSPRWYRRGIWGAALILALTAVLWIMLSDTVPAPTQKSLRSVAWLINTGHDLRMAYKITIYVVALFICCMVCHGEVYRLRPAANRLSGYYLLISAGGAFGGLFVAGAAPLLFKNYFELHAGLLLVGILLCAALFTDPKSFLYKGRSRWAWSLIAAGLLAMGYGLYHDIAKSRLNAVEMVRSFYGVLKVYEADSSSPEKHKMMLQHGSITHGFQFVEAQKHLLPVSYYTSTSGVGVAMKALPRQTARRIGVVGLGTGTMAAYGQAGDYIRFYEIDDNVRRIARTRFSYLNHSEAKIDVVLGDARLSLERELDEPFDILVLDAFSSDAIPVHLLTKEAFEVYHRRLKPDGVIAVHISNRYLNLEPVVRRQAKHIKFAAALITDDALTFDEDDTSGTYSSDWILLSRNWNFLNDPRVAGATKPSTKDLPKVSLWTDDASNLLPILTY